MTKKRLNHSIPRIQYALVILNIPEISSFLVKLSHSFKKKKKTFLQKKEKIISTTKKYSVSFLLCSEKRYCAYINELAVAPAAEKQFLIR